MKKSIKLRKAHNNSPMNLYRISADTIGYNQYDSAVVCAPDEETASRMHPDGATWNPEHWDCYGRSWAKSPKDVAVKLIGQATNNINVGVICASFNAI